MDILAKEYELSDQQIGRLFETLTKLSVNPITLSKSQCKVLKEHGIDTLHLPNMLHFIAEEKWYNELELS